MAILNKLRSTLFDSLIIGGAIFIVSVAGTISWKWANPTGVFSLMWFLTSFGILCTIGFAIGGAILKMFKIKR